MENPIATDDVYDGHNPLLPKLRQKPGTIELFGIVINVEESQFYL